MFWDFYKSAGWKVLHDGFYSIWQSKRGWMIMNCTDSVNFLVYDRVNKMVILAKQVRDPMMRPDNPDGMMVEVPGGRFDRNVGVFGLIKDEVFEELGVTAEEKDVELLNNGQLMALSAGVLTERSYLACVVVSPNQVEGGNKVYGVGEHERIDRIFMPLEEFKNFVCQDVKTFALKEWFLRVKLPQIEKEAA